MTELKLFLDQRRPKQDGTCPLVFRITVNRDTRYIPTGFSIKPIYWNIRYSVLRKKLPFYNAISKRLQELEETYYDRMLVYISRNPDSTSVQAIKEFILKGPKPKTTVKKFWSTEITALSNCNRHGGAKVYSDTLSALENVCSLDISFEEVNYRFLKDLEAKLFKRNCTINTVGVYMRTFKAIYNKAINSEDVGLEHYPFRNFKIRKEVKAPRTLTLKEIQDYFNYSISKESRYYNSWLLGKLMFMLIGINFLDLALLEDKSLLHGRIIFNRAKTGRQYSIKLLPEALKILEYFREDSRSSLLGIVKAEDISKEKLVLDIKQANKVFNAHLKIIGEDLKIKEKLTSYCFRYTWANVAKQLGYSKDMIAEALGHSYGTRVTGIYLEAFDLKHLDKMNQHVVKEVNKKHRKK